MAQTKSGIQLNTSTTQILQTIFEDVRALRQELFFLLPQEKLSDYASPHCLKKAYRKALKRYPPQEWK